MTDNNYIPSCEAEMLADPTMRMQNEEDVQRIAQLRKERSNAIADLLDLDPPLVTSVLVDLAECETLLDWAKHIEAYGLGYTGNLIDKLDRAHARLWERNAQDIARKGN